MKKNKAIITLLVMVLLLGGFAYTAVEGIGTEKAGAASGIKLGLDLAGGVSITYQVVGDEEPSAEDMADTIYKLQRRVEGYSNESQVYQEGSDRINIEIPGVSDANAILEELGKPGSLVFLDSSQNVVLTGTDIADARAATQQDQMGNSEFVVSLTMTEEGREKFAEATRAAYPTNDIISIVYDNVVIRTPRVQAEITDGQAVITGMESFEDAEQLASTIRIGGLRLELEELRSNVVGAQLGSTAIASSLKAAAVGFALVVVFMIVVYYVMGLAASFALGIYTALIVILLNLFEITLTLPGIAGIILSIGMAVDANVIIFARIREEIATGKTVNSAIKIGFNKATSAIVDGNITTFLAAVVLWLMGSGTVKGFAQTLMIGIVLSMVTAMIVTRVLLNALYGLGLKSEKLYGMSKERTSVKFLSGKVVFFAISLVIIIGGFVVMGINKGSTGDSLNYSMEFKGGTATTVTFNEDMTIEELDAEVVPYLEQITGDGYVQTQKVSGTTEVIIKTRTLTVEEREEMESVLSEHFGVEEGGIQSETISATVSGEMKRDAVIAVVIATICMLVYIWARFKDIRFATSAVAALVHDVLVVLTFYAVSKTSIGNTFIACMLTIVGYSINATIVIFDRIRENLKEMPKNTELSEVVNASITQTLTRSINTSVTTFIMVAVLYVLGVTSVREFALPLMVGIVCGAYSSVCITGALWYVMKTKIKGKKAK